MSTAAPMLWKRSGSTEEVDEAKLGRTLRQLCGTQNGATRSLSGLIDIPAVVKEAVEGICPGTCSTTLSSLAAQAAAARGGEHPDYLSLGGRMEVASLRKSTSDTFSGAVEQLRAHVGPLGPLPLVTGEFAAYVERHARELDDAIVQDRDMRFDFFGARTLLRGYLLRDTDGKTMERPQYMYMRVAVAVHGAAAADQGRDAASALADVLRAYDDLSTGRYSHASPTLFHAGTRLQQLSSCFLMGMYEDSVEGIYDTMKRCALVSKTAGGIGLAVSSVRAKDSYIRGTQGRSNGLVPMLRVVNDTARYIDQGGGRRRGAAAIYIEPWHADIMDVLEMKSNQGAEEARARDLFYALWVPDLFMRRVQTEADWSLFCPDECPGLDQCHGEEFETLYRRYEAEGRARATIPARALWSRVLDSQRETGGPYMLYKDACNLKSNHRHLGTIRCSNLCTEIVQYTSAQEVAVCNLGSLCLPEFLVGDGGDGGAVRFDYEALHAATRRLAVALDRVIDVNVYPVPQAKSSNRRHRPIGIGVQGLADVFAALGVPYDSDVARSTNIGVFSTIYHAALTASCALAERHGAYPSYEGSPVSQGQLQPDMWGVEPGAGGPTGAGAPAWDWEALRAAIGRHGVRNSLLTAPMPTASTAQIAGNTESFEPVTSNVFVRRVLSGEFLVVNRRMVAALEAHGLWPAARDELLRTGGSVQGLDGLPASVKATFRTVWEMKQRPLIDMAADRGPYIDQSQSLNVFMADADPDKLTAMHMYAWARGLKTGMYYLHSRPPREAVQFGLLGGQAGQGGGGGGGDGVASGATTARQNGSSVDGGEAVCESCSA